MADIGSLVVRIAMDNSNFQQGIQNINRSMKLIQSEFKNATAGLKDHGKGLDGLKAKQKMLSSSIEAQSGKLIKYKDKIKESENALKNNEIAHIKLSEKVDNARKAYEDSAKSLGKNAKETKELKAKYEELNKQYSDSEEKLRSNVKAIDNWNIKANYAETKLKNMKNELSKTSKEVAKQESNWNKLSKKLNSVGKQFETIGKKMYSIGKEMTTKISAPIVALGAGSAKAAISFESSFAGVKKTVNGTKEQFAKLEKGITDMSKKLPTSANEISHVAESAGQLGIQTDNILGFTKTIIDLGEATNLAGEEGASQLAKFANITQMSQKDFDRLGSTIVDLGNNLATTEADIVAMGMRLAGAGHQVGMTEAQIMGLSGALSSVGIEAEAGGSAMSKVIVQMQLAAETGGQSLNDFAKVSGMTAEQFKKSFKQDASGALISFIKGLSSCESKGTSAIKVLDDMGITEVRMRDALLRAAGAGDLFNKSIDIGTKAWQENTALTNEANQRYATTESKLKIVKNQIVDVGRIIGSNLLPIVREVATKIAELTERFSKLSPTVQQSIIKFAALLAVIGPIIQIGGKMVTAFRKVSRALGIVSEAIAVVKTGAAASTPVVAGLAKVFALLNWKIVAIGAAIGAVIYAGKKLHKHFSQASIQQQKFGNDISTTTKKALGEYEKLDKKVGQSLMNMRVKNSKITKDMAKDITGNFNKMSDQIIAANKKKYDKDYNTLKKFMSKNSGLRAEEEKEVLQNIKKKQKFEENIIKNGQKRINEIMQNAANNNRKISEEEWHEINTIKENMSQDAIRVMSNSEREQKSLLERQKRNAGTLSAEQAAEVVKNSANQRDKVIKEAEKQYDETVQTIQRQRDEEHTISKDKAEKLIAAAEHQKEVTVNKAKGQHTEIVGEAQKQAKEHVNEINWETGEVKSKWQAMVSNASSKAHEMKENTIKAFNEKKKAVSNKMTEIKTSIYNKWNEIINYFSKLPSKLRAKGSEMFESMKNGISSKLSSIQNKCSEIGRAIINAFKDIPKQALQIGHDIMNGLKQGLMNKIEEVKAAAGKVAEAASSKIKTALDIHSPSRVTRAYGQYTTEGLAIGILDNLSLVEEAVDLTTKTLLKLERNPDIKAKVNVSDQDISKVVNYILSWGDNSEKTYRQFVGSVNKMNISEIEETKKQLDRLYKDRKRNVEDTLRLVKKGSSKKLELEKANIDKQIAYYRNLQRNTKYKNAKKTYANQIARLQEYKKQVQLISKANTEKQIAELERSKSALEDYYELANRMLTDRKELVQDTLKEETSIFKDNINMYNEAIKLLSINTKDLTQNLINQQAIVNVQNKKIKELEKRYSKLLTTFGATAEETVKIRKELEESKIALVNYTNAVEEAQEAIYKHQIDTINNFTNKIKNVLQERYSKELKLQEDKINKELGNLNKWKDESIKRINDVYNAKIKALNDELKAEDKAEQDRAELKKINDLKQAITFEHNEFNKVELQKELNRSIAERNKRLHREDIENKKNTLEQKRQNEINSINNLYEANKANLEKQLSDTKKFYDEKLRITNLQAEAEKIIIDNNQQEIVDLMKSYDKDYEAAGKTLGEKFADGMKEKINPVLNMIQNIEDRIKTIRTQEIQKAINTAKYSPISSVGSSSINTSMTTNSKSIVNHNSITFNSPKELAPSEIRRQTETTLRNLAFLV
ncbi:phage tail tape measure protein [Clostridium niameyense]|uniref:Phage tail tape measure protein n=1 Tax=Clostridium niameyense TaxID=1622073 RepID=A0A6M0RCA5_9CLOT|nr:phage tail tape measure protein [Clostridium niameyense]NEZ47925.1 phage tail tape measure protein [Clostridium niameyense]